jgi:hypothetical protein
MRAVWSFWSKPFRSRTPFWKSDLHHLFSWVVSVETVKRYYPKTALFTDDEGARILIDGIGLEFECVSTELNALASQDPGWWTLGKLYAYRAMTEPFFHADSDVFLWKPLPKWLTAAPVFAQNPEPISELSSWYRPEVFDRALRPIEGAWLPREWAWYRTAGVGQRAECCGIVGGNRIDFINHYARIAIQLIEEPSNQPGWASLNDKVGHNILLEQYLLAACLDYHRSTPGSPYRDVSIAYLFDCLGAAYDELQAERVGFTHLMAAKRDGEVARRLEMRVMRDYPEYHERCRKYAEKMRSGS